MGEPRNADHSFGDQHLTHASNSAEFSERPFVRQACGGRRGRAGWIDVAISATVSTHSRRWNRFRLAGLVAAVGIALGCGGSSPKPLLISAASDLQDVSAALADQFHKETGLAVQFNFASSGTLT